MITKESILQSNLSEDEFLRRQAIAIQCQLATNTVQIVKARLKVALRQKEPIIIMRASEAWRDFNDSHADLSLSPASKRSFYRNFYSILGDNLSPEYHLTLLAEQSDVVVMVVIFAKQKIEALWDNHPIICEYAVTRSHALISDWCRWQLRRQLKGIRKQAIDDGLA